MSYLGGRGRRADCGARRGKRRLRVPRCSWLRGSGLSPGPPACSPCPGPCPWEAWPGVSSLRAARNGPTRLRGASSKQTLPAPPGAQLPGHSRAGRGRAVSKTVCSLAARQSPGDPCPGHPQPHLAPAARHLERSGSPPARGSPAARTHTHARQRARGPALMSAPPARAPPASLAHGSQDAPGIDAGARSARRIVSRLLYISSRAPGLGTRSGGSGP